MPKEPTPAERHALKGRAHRLDPVVMIGADGLTAAVLAEVDRALTAHELIKIRVTGGDGDAREQFLGAICTHREDPGGLPRAAARGRTAGSRHEGTFATCAAARFPAFSRRTSAGQTPLPLTITTRSGRP